MDFRMRVCWPAERAASAVLRSMEARLLTSGRPPTNRPIRERESPGWPRLMAEAAGVDFLRAMAMATTTTMAMVTYDQFSGADSMVVEWDELDVDLLKPDILLDCGISFVVHHIQVQDDAAGC